MNIRPLAFLASYFTACGKPSSAPEPAPVADRNPWLRLLPPLLLTILFLRIVWGMWNIRDLTPGDTSSYYQQALNFYRHLNCSIAWSPLYTSYFGSWGWLNTDPYFIVIAHRIGILAILTVLIYLISRRLLAPLSAWFVTAWWLVLPINYNALYEVHLFALIPVCLFWLLLAWRPSLPVRGVALGILVISTVLMRNELLIAFGLFGALSIGYDLWELRTGRAQFVPTRYLLAYGIPLLVAIMMIRIAYWRSVDKFPSLSVQLKYKHTVNVSQIYTFGYRQRHPGYKIDPWSGYGPLMVHDFGRELLTMREAFEANPSAMIEHFLWNVRLIPSGLQVGLFNCRSGDVNPDYVGTLRHPPLALALSGIYLVIVISGGVLLIRHRRYWWDSWLRDRAWVIAAILSICATVAIVMVMQRPRPSYMFAQTLALMWLAGFCLQVIAHHLRVGRQFALYALLPMAAITFLAPRSFDVEFSPEPASAPAKTRSPAKTPSILGKQFDRFWRKQFEPFLRKQFKRFMREQIDPLADFQRPRILLTEYRLLARARADRKKRNGVMAAADYPSELATYLDLPNGAEGTEVIDTVPIIDALGANDSLDAALKKRNVVAVVINFDQEGVPKIDEFMDNASRNGWTLADKRVDLKCDFWLYEFAP